MRRTWIWIVLLSGAAGLVAFDLAFGAPVVRGAAAFLGFVEPHRDSKIYWCPMHPFYKVNKYGICPYCNMALEEYAGAPGAAEAEPVLILTDRQIQQAGVRTERVAKRRLVSEVLTSGILERNKERSWSVNTRFEGWIEEILVNAEGERIEQGRPIARIYSPQLYSAQEEYLLSKGDPALQAQARRKLELLGIQTEEIEELERRGAATSRLTIRSPYGGTVIRRHANAGMKIPPGGSLIDVADLRELWIYADVYDRQLGLVRVGQAARVRVDAYPSETFAGRVDLIEPQVRAETQTGRVRIRVENDPVRLLPGQFARVLLLDEGAPALSVSEHAVIPTGRRDLVIVALGGGRFTAKEVRLGRRSLTAVDPEPDDRGLPFFTGHDRYHQVLGGLAEGETVATSGAFLLHAEAQIRQLIEKMLPPRPPAGPARSAWSGARLEAPLRVGERAFLDRAELERFEADPSAAWETRFPAVREAAAEAFAQYFLVHDAVVAEKLALAAEYAEAFPAIAQAMTAPISDVFDKAEADRIRSIAGELADAARAPAGSKGFGALSVPLERWVESYGPPVQPLYQFYCGMAKKSVGSPTERWFQKDGELRNPFGMRGCGSLEKTHAHGH